MKIAGAGWGFLLGNAVQTLSRLLIVPLSRLYMYMWMPLCSIGGSGALQLRLDVLKKLRSSCHDITTPAPPANHIAATPLRMCDSISIHITVDDKTI